jgi:hypothetical protein
MGRPRSVLSAGFRSSRVDKSVRFDAEPDDLVDDASVPLARHSRQECRADLRHRYPHAELGAARQCRVTS